jgi:DNA mismatch endonuclease (patch repair protein)
MVDIVDSTTRSRMMASIKGRDTSPERLVRSFLHRAGLRFRLHVAGMPGRPDIVLPRWRTVVFVNGCFWHRHTGCRFATVPATRADFWSSKLAANVARDARQKASLEAAGWNVVVFWECHVKSVGQLDALVRSIRRLQPQGATATTI